MTYVKVAQLSEIPMGSKKKVTANGKDILMANIKGSYYAVNNTCTHMGGSLNEGELNGNHIVCPRHGSVFDVTTGKAVDGGKMLFMKIQPRDLKSYPVKIEGNDVLIGFE